MFRYYRIRIMSLTVFMLAVLVVASPAQAVNVTVGGTTYDVQFFPGGQSFDDNAAALTPPNAPPWWGSLATATDFANAYGAQAGPPYPFDVTGGSDFLFFAYNNPSTFVEFAYLTESGSVTSTSLSQTTSFSGYHYAYTTPLSSVPEIDGGALAQAGLILLAMWLVLRGRRRQVT